MVTSLLHLDIHTEMLEVRAVEVTDNRTCDATMLPELLPQTPEPTGLASLKTDQCVRMHLCPWPGKVAPSGINAKDSFGQETCAGPEIGGDGR